MKYARLGDTGLEVSRICLGTSGYGDPARGHSMNAGSQVRSWTLDEREARPLFKHAIDLGVIYFDTANVYSYGASEEITGRALRDFAKREDVVITTKLWNAMRPGPNGRGLSRKAILHEIDASLARLRTDYVDVYMIHRWDDATPIEETMEALHDVVRAGKARYLGASSMHAWQLAKAQRVAAMHGWTRFVVMQNHYNLLNREEEREMNPQCVDMGVATTPWSPLARGLLARAPNAAPTRRSETDTLTKGLYGHTVDADAPVLAALDEVAQRRGLRHAQVALAWLLQRPSVVAPILGATKTEHLDDAARALDVVLTREDIDALETPYVPHDPAGF